MPTGSCLPQLAVAPGASRGSRRPGHPRSSQRFIAPLPCGARVSIGPPGQGAGTKPPPVSPGALVHCGLTIHSSRSRFAARLNSSVRQHVRLQSTRLNNLGSGSVCLHPPASGFDLAWIPGPNRALVNIRRDPSDTWPKLGALLAALPRVRYRCCRIRVLVVSRQQAIDSHAFSSAA